MSEGIFFFVVGPSGAGKDSLIDAVRDSDRPFVIARRVITRAHGSPGEAHEARDEAGFSAMECQGGFLLTWSAHGLRYGLRRELLDVLSQGRHVIANGSRAMVETLRTRVPRMVVVEVTAPASVLAERILARGRETQEEVQQRVMRKVEPFPADVEVIKVSNDGTLEEGIERFVAALDRATQPPAPSMAAMKAKLAGDVLNESQYGAVLDDILALRYSDRDINAFLLHASQHLSDPEVLALAKVRAKLSPRIEWNEQILVDKHSMGGIPGSRITLIVVPIVTAFGLTMPKTSSRAITSAAGTADAMETVARVDLTRAEVQQCVKEARGCIAWNGRLNHSLIDDRINAFTRPLGLDSNRWSVASILSKKWSAGSTHVIIDLPYGPRAKLKNESEARALGQLFEYVGAGLGMHVKAMVTDGKGPIGRGVGPALEVRDVRLVLSNAVDAPSDLREKALQFAAEILAWAPDVGTVAKGREMAESLLESGKALASFERIIDAQGRRARPVLPGKHVRKVVARHSGVITSVDGWAVAGIARAAGAPNDLSAGVDLLVSAGQTVEAGDVLFQIYGNDAEAVANAAESAKHLATHDISAERFSPSIRVSA
ncbi:thymidine phosphorylase [Burkholderia sp. Leaf177]|uniref:phosphonate metabolism protein/1,5-bisphosphokinase (PRPP-forming) PhnN n=1 Tax=Burkholderia sp. Leaf177 TaxID=1736287 RepID=UPI0006F962A6|nr:phosphonate metabolism protein/1,5-bisphosphokinase (PRPP-forming) PhnN [Burkholderia sp. Leaf177]KQR74097.1 thymidine phosphorylase [Burkholderia sp. Leaf177]